MDAFLRAFYWRQCRTTRGRVAAQCQPAPAPPGGQVQNTKKITNTAWGVGVGESINGGLQGQALLTVSHSHPEFSKIQIVKIYNPSVLLTKIKSQVPNEPRVGRRLEDQGPQDGDRWKRSGKNRTRKDGAGRRQPETARNNQKGRDS